MEKDTRKTVIKILVGSMAAFFVLLIVALIINIARLSAANSRREQLAAQSAALDELIAENNALIDYCKTPEFIEDYARTYLDMVKRGEIVIGVK